MATYKIGDLAKLLGVTTHTLRFYEKNGLLSPSQRTEANYRVYNDNDRRTAAFIIQSRELGFSLQDIAAFLSIRAHKDRHTCEEAKRIADAKIVEIETQIQKLQRVLVALKRLSDACCGGPESATQCTIIDTLDQVTSKETAV